MVDDVLLNRRKGNRMTKRCRFFDEEPACDVWLCMVGLTGFILFFSIRHSNLVHKLETCFSLTTGAGVAM